MDARKALEALTDLLHNGPNSVFNFARLEDTWFLRTCKEDRVVRNTELRKTKIVHVCQPEKAYQMISTNKSAHPFMGTVNDDGICNRCKKAAPEMVVNRWRIISKLHAAPKV